MVREKPSRWVRPTTWAAIALLLLAGNVALFALAATTGVFALQPVVLILLLAQSAVALVAVLLGLFRLAVADSLRARLVALGAAVIAAPAGWLGLMGAAFMAGGAGWGRPLRVRGRPVHPELRLGSDWELGDRPHPTGLDEAARAALEALWLHDAQKEHASVPAFARVSWLLAAAGAPADLLRGSHRAAIEEIAHARLCFAIAAGYGGRSHTVLPMPELLGAGLAVDGDACEVLLAESLADGCLLEDFNADVAAECAGVCEEPVTRRALERIAREERSHAEFSWAVVQWALQQGGGTIAATLARAIDDLAGYARPTAVGDDARAIVACADAAALRRHGRLPDARWAELWRERLARTEVRARAMLAAPAVVGG